MKNSNFVRAIALLVTAAFLAAPGIHKNALADNAEGSVSVASEESGAITISNRQVELACSRSDGSIRLSDLNTGNIYYSTPADTAALESTDALNRVRLKSQIILQLCNESGEVTSANSSSLAANKLISIKKDGGSIVCSYDFRDYSIKISVKYTLNKNGFSACIPMDSIECKGSYSLMQVSLLPYFAAADVNESGYFVVPDGCGALIDFNNGKAALGNYSQKIYGPDAIQNASKMTETTQPALLPVIGIHRNAAEKAGSNMLLYVEDGAACATANAAVSTASLGYNNAYFSFTYKSSNRVTMLEDTDFSSSVYMLSNNTPSAKSFTVSYNLLSSDGDYNEMAQVTRDLLKADSLKDDWENGDRVFIEAYMSVKKEKYFLGIPYNANETLTKFDDCLKLIEKINGNAVMLLNGVDPDGAVGGKIDSKFRVSSGLGGIKAYKKFVQQAEKSGAAVFPAAELVKFNKSSIGYNTYFNNARSVDYKPILERFYLFGNYEENKKYPELSYLIPAKTVTAGNSYVKSLVKNGITGAAPLSVGNSPYSSADGKGCDLTSVMQNYIKILEDMRNKQINVLLKSPAAYAIPYAKYLYSLPLRSSSFSVCDTDIPFLQLVLNGVKNYSTPALNLTNNREEMRLRMIESGSSPAYSVIGAKYADIKSTPLDVLYGAEMDTLSEEILSEIAEYRNVFEATGGLIESHRIINGNLRKVTFKNGTSVYLNYSDTPQTYDGIQIDALSYSLTQAREGEQS
mgnify:FL=1